MKNNRLILLFIMTLGIMALVTSNVFCVSVLKIHLLSGTDLNPYCADANTKVENIKARRGYIYDRNSEIIAQDITTYRMICILSKTRTGIGNTIAYVDDPVKTAKLLAPIIKMDEQEMINLLSKEVYQVELGNYGKNLSKQTKEEIEQVCLDNDLHGIEFIETIKRDYPFNTFASNLIGYALTDDSGSTSGKMGLEEFYDAQLCGTDGKKVYQADKYGYILPGMHVEETEVIDGNDMYLTIDKDMQLALEQAFQETTEIFNPSRIWGGVMEIDTGKMLAWGQSPSFDPNVRDIEDYNNYGSQLPYEVGSTMKPFTWAAAIDTGNYDGSVLVNSGAFHYQSDNHRNPYRVSSGGIGTLENVNSLNWGYVPYDYGLIYSSNTITSSVLTSLINPTIFKEYLDKFHFFEKVETDGLKEETGILSYNWPSEKLSTSFGQSSTWTALQLMQAYSAIFGDGEMMKPYFVDRIVSSKDQSIVYQANPTIVDTPIKSSTADTLQDILRRVVSDEEGTARFYEIPEVEIMAKTGTAEVPVNGRYGSGITIASVAIGLPYDNPKYLVYYAFEANHDRNAHFKTSPVTNLLKKIVMYGEIDSIKNENTNSSELIEYQEELMPALINHSTSYATNKLQNISSNVYYLGEGDTVIEQYPLEGNTVITNQKIFILCNKEQFIMPDMLGWTMKEVVNFWQVTKFAFALDGDGKVISQSIAPGEVVTADQQIKVELE